MADTYRVRVHRQWLGGGATDPETYWCTADEAAQLLDDVLQADGRTVTLWPVESVEVATFVGLHTSLAAPPERIGYRDEYR